MVEICIHDVFLVCNFAVLPAWALLIVQPDGLWTRRLVHSGLIPLILALVYVWAFASNPEAPVDAGFMSLEGVMRFFTSPWLVLAGWVHYLAFDLFVGAWLTRDASRNGIRHVLVVPCLIATLLAGPIGLGSYLVLRQVLRVEPELTTRVPAGHAEN
jgi:hypothetical protein